VKLRVALLTLVIAIAVFVGESQATVTAVGLTLSESSSSAAVSGSTLYYAPGSSGSFTRTFGGRSMLALRRARLVRFWMRSAT